MMDLEPITISREAVQQRVDAIRQRWLEDRAGSELRSEERQRRWRDAEERQRREEAARVAALEAIAAHDRLLDRLAEEASRVEVEVLQGAGYHRHDRGPWRRRRRRRGAAR